MIFTIQKTAATAGISAWTLYKWIEKGWVTVTCAGRRRTFTQAQLEFACELARTRKALRTKGVSQ